MGLLDLGIDDPNTTGLLSLGLRLMSTPGKFGTALGQSGLGAMGDMRQAQQLMELRQAREQEAKQNAIRQQMMEMQLAQARQAQAEQEAMRTLAQQSARTPGQVAVAQNGGPTLAAAAAMPTTSPGFDWNGYAQGVAAINPVKSLEIQQLLKKEQPKLKSVEPMRDPTTGKMVNVALFEDGTNKVLPYGVKPEIALQALGNRVVALDKNALPNGASFAMGQSPDSVASNAVTARGQDMTARTAADRLAWDKDSAGGYEYKTDGDGSLIAVPKRPGAGPIQPIPVAATNKGVKNANEALALIDQARALIPQSTGSYVGAGVDQAARVVGLSTGGDKAASQLKALEGALMLRQPRMEGPQSDKDTALYRQMAGQIGDPTVPPEIKLAALDTIRQIHERYAGINQAPPWLNKPQGLGASPSGAPQFLGFEK